MSVPGVRTGVRASDDERERIAQVLQGAAAEGRLSPEEAGERLASASAATYREELHHLIADLPVARVREESARAPWRVAFGALAFVAVLAVGFMAFWGLRFFWPWGLVALFILSRPWRRRWRYLAWRGRRPGWETS